MFLILVSALLLLTAVNSRTEFPFVAPFIYKSKLPPAPVCSGTIITEKHVLTAAYPIAVMPRGYHCLLPGYGDLNEVPYNVIENECIDLKTVLLDEGWKPKNTSLNLAVVVLQKKIRFTWSISTARLPFPDFPTLFKHNKSCVIPAWLHREVIDVPGFPLAKIAYKLIRENVELDVHDKQFSYIWPEDGLEHLYICSAHLGVPVICDCNVVGVLASENLTGFIECANFLSFSYVGTLTLETLKFLDATIPNY